MSKVCFAHSSNPTSADKLQLAAQNTSPGLLCEHPISFHSNITISTLILRASATQCTIPASSTAPLVFRRHGSGRGAPTMGSHLHELFDARLFSIHADTLRIRAFMPYDILLDYRGRAAQVPVNVDCGALRHHYEMCCIGNMGAKVP